MIFKVKRSCLLPLILANICCPGSAFHYSYDQICTAEGKSGECIIVSECDYATNIIKKFSISSPESQNFLKSNRCGFEGEIPKICCPKKESIVDNRNAFKQEESQILESDKKETDNSKTPHEKNPLLLLPSKCGMHLSNRIMGGEDTDLSEFPWVVALEYEEIENEDPIIGCAGSLITQRWVLTAAHCVRTTSNVRLIKVRLGEYNIITERDCLDKGNGSRKCADPILSIPIENQIVHENFMSPHLYRNDVALLRLAHDAPITDFIQPICLPFTNDTGKFYWSAGWGQTETNRNSDVKLKILLPYFDFPRCAAIYSSKKVVLGTGQMCAGGQPAKDTCRGDSGAPLMRQLEQIGGNDVWVIEGVLSIGSFDCGLAEWPAVYTKVYDYLPWILNKLRT